jgi:hypothetical protein
MAIIVRLKTQLPKKSPMAKSGTFTRAAALMPVTISGMEVTRANSSMPIQMQPSPVFSAMASPYFASLVPANRITIRQKINFSQTKSKVPFGVK